MLARRELLGNQDQEVILVPRVRQDNQVSQEHKVQPDREDPRVTRGNQAQMDNRAVQDLQEHLAHLEHQGCLEELEALVLWEI